MSARIYIYFWCVAFVAISARAATDRTALITRSVPNLPTIGTRFGPPGLPTTRTFTSANGKYRVVMEEDSSVLRMSNGLSMGTSQRVTVTATIIDVTGRNPTNLWRATFKCSPIGYLQEGDVVIANDGTYCVLPTATQQWTVLKKDSHVWTTPALPLTSQRFVRGPDNGFAELDSIEGKIILRTWSRADDEWRAYWLDNGDTVKQDAVLEKRWNEASSRRIRELIERARLTETRQRITQTLMPTLSKIALGAVPVLKPGELKDLHYEFLAMRKAPGDRKIFERMLEHNLGLDPQIFPGRAMPTARLFTRAPAASSGISMMRMGQIFGRRNGLYSFEMGDYERMRGDFLLAIYDGKARPDTSSYSQLPPTTFNLGRVYGSIKMPAPISGNSGYMRIYLANEERAGKSWGDADVDAIVLPMESAMVEFSDEVSFGFLSARPGRYKAKAIWDKRRSFDGVRAAGPGDYESAWVGPIVVTASGIVQGVRLACTNRVVGGEAYYRADEMLAKSHAPRKVVEKTEEEKTRDEVFAAGFSKWVTKTNSHTKAGRDALTRVALVAQEKSAKSNALERPPELRVQWWNTSFVPGETLVVPKSLLIYDEHGCAFAPKYIKSNRRFSVAAFPGFPRSAATWRLVGYGEGGRGDVLFDYTLTNLVKTARAKPMKVETLPLELTVGDVRMKVARVSGFSADGWIEATFTEKEKPTDGWWVAEAIFEDDDGNVIDPQEMCREMKVTRVLGRISRTPLDKPDETRRFEFAIERLKAFVAPQL